MFWPGSILVTSSSKLNCGSAHTASIRYQGRTGLGLAATLYGQQVKMLDTSGTLANLGKKKSVVEVAHEVPDA